MKIIFMGSAEFAVASLEALASSRHKITEVVTQPDKPAGRGQQIKVCPAAEAAKKLGLPLYQPKGVKRPDRIEHFRNLSPDLIAVVAYGKILPKELLEIPPKGCVNVHASLLPKYRGAAPINWAIVKGETETGITVQRIAEEMDAGDILLSCKIRIDEAETAKQLHDKLAPIGAELLLKTINGLEDGSIKPFPQDHSKATFAPIIEKEDGHIDWKKTSTDIYNMVRGFTPWPGTFAKLDGKTLRVHKVTPTDAHSSEGPGTVIESDKHLSIACGKGTLYLLEVQLEGKKRMPIADFLRGHAVKIGTVLY